MPDQKNSSEPPDNPAAHTPLHAEKIDPLCKQEHAMAENSQRYSKHDQEFEKDLKRELHWVEKANFWTQIILGLIGIAALVVYYRQLGEMKNATVAANNALNTANESLWRDKRSHADSFRHRRTVPTLRP